MLEPDEALIDFATSLPDTIRVNILVGCLIAFDRLETRGDQDHMADFRSILEARGSMKRSYRVAAMTGAMMLALQDEEGEADLWQRLHEEHGEPIFKIAALKAPLIYRHRQLAREAFETLLQGPLSARMLHAWQAHLMVTDPLSAPDF